MPFLAFLAIMVHVDEHPLVTYAPAGLPQPQEHRRIPTSLTLAAILTCSTAAAVLFATPSDFQDSVSQLRVLVTKASPPLSALQSTAYQRGISPSAMARSSVTGRSTTTTMRTTLPETEAENYTDPVPARAFGRWAAAGLATVLATVLWLMRHWRQQRATTSAMFSTSSTTSGGPSKAPAWVTIFYAVLFVGCTAAIGVTLYNYPLFPMQLDSLAWCSTWLLTTCADYYGAALCLSGVILASERFPAGPLWVAGCCLLGSPVCCAWVLQRLYRHGTLGLRDTHGLA